MSTRVRLLGGVATLRSLTIKEKRALARALIPEDFAAGAHVITAGDEGDAMFIVQDGDLEAISADESTHFMDYGSGTAFGELALISRAKRAATVRCVTAATVLRLSRESFDLLIGNIGGCIEELRKNLKMRAFSNGKLDYHWLFRQCNLSKSVSATALWRV